MILYYYLNRAYGKNYLSAFFSLKEGKSLVITIIKVMSKYSLTRFEVGNVALNLKHKYF